MLFDLQGKRRRVVQISYLGLAILLGGGLVLTGIGSSASGGLLDAFKGGGSGGNQGSKIVQDQIKSAEKRVAANPHDELALKAIVRGHYQLATADADPNTGNFGAKGKQELSKAAITWERYLALNPKKPDPSLAGLMVQAYSGLATGNNNAAASKALYGKAAATAEILAAAQPGAETYLRLVQFAALAGQTRKADLAGRKAIQLAPKGQRDTVKKLVDQAKAGAAGAGSQTAPAP
jgi:hypothetical protein